MNRTLLMASLISCLTGLALAAPAGPDQDTLEGVVQFFADECLTIPNPPTYINSRLYIDFYYEGKDSGLGARCISNCWADSTNMARNEFPFAVSAIHQRGGNHSLIVKVRGYEALGYRVAKIDPPRIDLATRELPSITISIVYPFELNKKNRQRLFTVAQNLLSTEPEKAGCLFGEASRDNSAEAWTFAMEAERILVAENRQELAFAAFKGKDPGAAGFSDDVAFKRCATMAHVYRAAANADLVGRAVAVSVYTKALALKPGNVDVLSIGMACIMDPLVQPPGTGNQVTDKSIAEYILTDQSLKAAFRDFYSTAKFPSKQELSGEWSQQSLSTAVRSVRNNMVEIP